MNPKIPTPKASAEAGSGPKDEFTETSLHAFGTRQKDGYTIEVTVESTATPQAIAEQLQELYDNSRAAGQFEVLADPMNPGRQRIVFERSFSEDLESLLFLNFVGGGNRFVVEQPRTVEQAVVTQLALEFGEEQEQLELDPKNGAGLAVAAALAVLKDGRAKVTFVPEVIQEGLKATNAENALAGLGNPAIHPVGTLFTLTVDEQDDYDSNDPARSDESDWTRVTPAGSIWKIVAHEAYDDPIVQYGAVCPATGGWIHLGHSELEQVGFKAITEQEAPDNWFVTPGWKPEINDFVDVDGATFRLRAADFWREHRLADFGLEGYSSVVSMLDGAPPKSSTARAVLNLVDDQDDGVTGFQFIGPVGECIEKGDDLIGHLHSLCNPNRWDGKLARKSVVLDELRQHYSRDESKAPAPQEMVGELLYALKDLLGDQPWFQDGKCLHCGREYPESEDEEPPEECSDDCPGEMARVAIAKAEAAISRAAQKGVVVSAPVLDAIISQLIAKGEPDMDLDGLVHDLASRAASDVNNGGIRDQVEYLVKHMGLSAACKELGVQDPSVAHKESTP